MDELDTYLAQIAEKPFAFGQCDCVLAAFDWFDRAAKTQLAEFLHRAWVSEKTATLFMGGKPLAELCRDYLTELWEVKDVRRGDVGVIQIWGVQYGAICVDTGHWAVKGRKGLDIVKASPVVAFGVR